MKCNLDCRYCPTGIYGGHDNSTNHPQLTDCLNTIDFMYQYVDQIMKNKVNGIKHVVLNIYGGESLHHPNIVEILRQCRLKHENFKNHWSLTITTTTNAIVSPSKLQKIIPLIDEFTVSYHTEHTKKQRQQFNENLLAIKDSGKRIKCVVLMHNNKHFFEDAQEQIEWLTEQGIKHLPRQLDDHRGDFKYDIKQIKWFNKLYQERSNVTLEPINEDKTVSLSTIGRACCGGRSFSCNKEYKQKQFYIQNNRFTDWYCSVDEFFLYVKQVNGEVYVNKDCKMNYNGEVGPIGFLSNTDAILSKIGKTPTIQCKKSSCWCGLCAPKSDSLEDFNLIMKKYRKNV